MAGNGGGIAVASTFTGQNSNFADLGGSFFLKNLGDGSGGAIYFDKGAKVAALTGDVIFQDNLINNNVGISLNSDGESRSNGLYFANFDNNGMAAIGAAENCTFWNYDGVCGNRDASSNQHKPQLTVQINPDSKQGGTVLFDRYRSDIWFETTTGATVSYGTMVLQNGASFGAGESNFCQVAPNSGPFNLGSNATLRIAYGQDIKRYTFNEDTFKIESVTEVVPYDPLSQLSEIGAGSVVLEGKLHFILPSTVANGNIMLQIPLGTVRIANSATIDVGVSACTKDRLTLLPDQSVTLLTCSDLTCDAELPVECNGATITGVGIQSGYQFRV
ncbi:MAG: hypothetical protein LBB14_00500 [Puniceicoccales bacterium]|jgi:hypothetical protein|nr:hypothetical protein [Puniceicoccales bacterium]